MILTLTRDDQSTYSRDAEKLMSQMTGTRPEDGARVTFSGEDQVMVVLKRLLDTNYAIDIEIAESQIEQITFIMSDKTELGSLSDLLDAKLELNDEGTKNLLWAIFSSGDHTSDCTRLNCVCFEEEEQS